jgi:hypothetical protein
MIADDPPPDESESSGSQYKDGSHDSEEEDPEEEEELKDKEPDTRIQVKSGKKQKKGLVTRDQISVAAAEIDNLADKRVMGSNPQ